VDVEVVGSKRVFDQSDNARCTDANVNWSHQHATWQSQPSQCIKERCFGNWPSCLSWVSVLVQMVRWGISDLRQSLLVHEGDEMVDPVAALKQIWRYCSTWVVLVPKEYITVTELPCPMTGECGALRSPSLTHPQYGLFHSSQAPFRRSNVPLFRSIGHAYLTVRVTLSRSAAKFHK
jgi:hypothetical protein